MKTKINSQYRFATFVAILGTFSNGIMRYFENGSYFAWETHTYLSAHLSIATAVIIFFEHLLLRNFKYTPFVIVSTITFSLTIGSYITTEWDHYYLASLSMIGVMCLYGQIRPLILYLAANTTLNIFVLIFMFGDAPDGFRDHMVMSYYLYLYGAVFLSVLFYRAYKRQDAAQSGLQSFSSLLSTTPNLMVIVDGNRRVRYISSRLAEFAGMDEAIAVGRPLIDLFKEESLKLMFADILDADDFYSATREIDMNDEPHYYKIIADRLSDSNDGMFIEITDMTEIVLASIEAEEARREAEAANRSKSDFLATMSHEIRTPMNAIIGISEIQLLRSDLADDIKQAFRQTHVSSHGLLGIINDILDLSKIETGKLELNPTEYDVASLINDALHLNMVRIGSKPIVCTLELSDNLPAKLYGDELRLKQILNNILSNAFKYTEEGSVSLSVSHRVVENGLELCFIVTDTGQGMKPEDLSRLFEEYSRFNESVNRLTEGTGLGMNITRRLVNMMGGNIKVESDYGKGSTFTITILQQFSEDKSVIGPEHAERLRNFTYTIDRDIQSINIKREFMPYGKVLIVDDVETNLYVARGLLTPYGLTIETAVSGFEAIEKIESGAVYDIVFMDHMMPKMDGVETTQKLREKGYKGAIIALTANAIVGNDKFFKDNGFEDFISKPIDIRQMNSILNQYVRDKSAKQQLRESENTPAPATAQTTVTATTPTTSPAPVLSVVDEELLNIFRRDAMKAISTLMESRANGDYKLFATTAHAMKSAAANIGEMGTSKVAGLLELAGNKADKAYIDENTPVLIDALVKIIAKGVEE